jgi:hypothetical protein
MRLNLVSAQYHRSDQVLGLWVRELQMQHRQKVDRAMGRGYNSDHASVTSVTICLNTKILSRGDARVIFCGSISSEGTVKIFSSRTTKSLCFGLGGVLLILLLGPYVTWPLTHRYGGGHDRDIREELMTAFPHWFRQGTSDYPGNFKFYTGEGWESDFPSLHLCDDLIVYEVPQLSEQEAVLRKLKELRREYRANPIRVEFRVHSRVEKWTGTDGGKGVERMEGPTVRTAWIY